MEQIIGSYKEFIVLERKSVEEMLQRAEDILEQNEDTKSPPNERYLIIKEMCEWIKDNNIYNKEFHIKK